MFDLDADPLSIGAHLSRDVRLAPLVAAAPGMRLPLTWEPFEAVVRAVLGQQISVAGAVRIAGRLAERYGRPIDGGGTIQRLFPGPSELARADFSGFGVPASRARTLAAAAQATLDGRLRFDSSVRPDELEKALKSIPGIGPWSVQYIALRGMGEPDAFPESDLGIRKALDALRYPAHRSRRKEAIALLAPWRGYAAIYFWRALSVGS
jgi:3-methyladenine DNA glycosylase/8-oxoguanine DNA glycosylase